eukprot:53067_1
MANANSPPTSIIENIKSWYNDDSNKTMKLALAFVAGSAVAYAVYTYNQTNQPDTEKPLATDTVSLNRIASDYAPDMSPSEEVKESKEDIQRKKAEKLAAKKKQKAVQKIIDGLINERTMLIVDGKGWNIKYFASYYGKIEKIRNTFLRLQCQTCKNICRDCVEIEQPQEVDDDKDPVVMCQVCAIAGDKKYTAFKVFRKTVLNETIVLPDPQKQEAIEWSMKNDLTVESAEEAEEKSIFHNKIFWGRLKKCINTKIPQYAEEEYEKGLKAAEFAKIKLENGVKRDLDWKFHDDSNTKEALFFVSEDGLTATSNKRSGTVLFGPLIMAVKYSKRKWVEDWSCAGNYYQIELKIHESDGCSVGFCQEDFNQFVGKNEGQIKSLMLNQTGWFYTSRTFKHEWEHSRQSPMGKWFKSDDVIVIVIDCTDAHNVKGEIYNKANEKNKFTIEKLPKKIGVAVNIIVGSNPKGTVKPGVTVVSATVERRI